MLHHDFLLVMLHDDYQNTCHVRDKHGLMAYINYAPMRIGAEDPWALTELAKAGEPGGGTAPPA